MMEDTEKAERKFNTKYLHSNDVVLELGAGKGYISISMAMVTHRVIAVEMDARNYMFLQAIVRPPRIQPILAGVGDKLGLSWYFRRSEYWNTSRVNGKVFGDKGVRRLALFVPIKWLLAIYHPTVLVMDIEGDELVIAKELVRCKPSLRPKMVLLEKHQAILGDNTGILDWLFTSAGYILEEEQTKNEFVSLQAYIRKDEINVSDI